MNQYHGLIVGYTGCSIDDVYEVEDIMRHDVVHSTLDWLTPEQFKRAAVTAYAVLKELATA